MFCARCHASPVATWSIRLLSKAVVQTIVTTLDPEAELEHETNIGEVSSMCCSTRMRRAYIVRAQACQGRIVQDLMYPIG